MQKHLTEFHIHMDKPLCVKKNTGRSRVWCQRAVTPVVWETEGGLSQSGVLRGGRLGSRTECTAWWCTVSKRKTKAENLSSLCRTLDSSPSPRTGRVDGDFNLRRCIQKKKPTKPTSFTMVYDEKPFLYKKKWARASTALQGNIQVPASATQLKKEFSCSLC